MPAQKPQGRQAEATLSLKRTGGILADGIYQFRIEKSEQKAGSAAPYFALRLKEVSGKGNTVFKNLSLSENARFIAEQFLDACGFPPDGPAVKAQHLVGKRFWAKVGNRDYKGTLQNEILAFLTKEAAEAALADLAGQVDEEEVFDDSYEGSEDGDETGATYGDEDDGDADDVDPTFRPSADLDAGEEATGEADEFPEGVPM